MVGTDGGDRKSAHTYFCMRYHIATCLKLAMRDAFSLRANTSLLSTADNVSLPEHLQRGVEFMEKHPEVGMVGAGMEAIDATGASLPNFALPIRRLHVPATRSSRLLYTYCDQVHCMCALSEWSGALNLAMEMLQSSSDWKYVGRRAIANLHLQRRGSIERTIDFCRVSSRRAMQHAD